MEINLKIRQLSITEIELDTELSVAYIMVSVAYIMAWQFKICQY